MSCKGLGSFVLGRWSPEYFRWKKYSRVFVPRHLLLACCVKVVELFLALHGCKAYHHILPWKVNVINFSSGLRMEKDIGVFIGSSSSLES